MWAKLGFVSALVWMTAACTLSEDGRGKDGNTSDDTDTTDDTTNDTVVGYCESGAPDNCPGDSHCESVEGSGSAYNCVCDEAFFGSGYNDCSPRVTEGGECDMDAAGNVTCDCNPGYEQINPTDRFCTLVDEPVVVGFCESGAPDACDPNSHCQSVAGSATDYTCPCDAAYFGQGDDLCYPRVTPSGTCGMDASGIITCSCNFGFEHANATDTACSEIIGYCESGAPDNCPVNSHCESVPGSGSLYNCPCDADYFGTGYATCFARVTEDGTCDQDAAGVVTCTCDAGFHQATPRDTACSDIDECSLPTNTCQAWCVNLPGTSDCISTVADPTSPYWDDTCDPGFSFYETQTELLADCRCGDNSQPVFVGGLEICQRPSTVSASVSFGTGPSLRDLSNLRTYAGAFDIPNRKLYVGVGWTDPTNSYRGEIVEVDADTGDRRVLSGTWPGRYDWEEYGAGPFLNEVQNLTLREDGELYAWTRSQLGNAQILHVDKQTGDRTLVWAEHIPNDPNNDPAWAQCSSGATLGRTWVQIWERGLLVEPDGSLLLSVVSNGAAAQATPLGVVRISPDGGACEWVTRLGAGSAINMPQIGSGYGPQAGIEFTNMFWVNGMIWSYDSFGAIWQIDPANGNRRKMIEGLASDWLSWDDERQAYWVSGAGGGANNIQAWWPDNDQVYDISVSNIATEVRPGMWMGILEGPGSTCCQNHLPTHYDPQDGNLFVWHDVFGLLKMEPETGNTYNFSL